VLVLIVGQKGLTDRKWFAEWLPDHAPADFPDRTALTVFQAGADPPSLLPTDALRAINAQFWKDSVTEAVPAILSLAGVTLESQRIFISYRRVETQPLAEQLFDALTHAGFDVFLDRFSIQPGLNFQQRLTQELADKSMVMLLESAWVHTSEWTDHEIQFAKRYQLGLLSLQLPDRAEPLGTIDADLRVPLFDDVHRPNEFFASAPTPVNNPDSATNKLPPHYNQWGPLKKEHLETVVLKAKAAHDQALFRRRRFIQRSVAASLDQAGLGSCAIGPDGLMRVSAKAEYALWLTTRPPQTGDFQTTHARVHPPPGTKGIVIGPTAALEPDRKATLDWLTKLCDFTCIDQDDLPQAIELMKRGTL